MIPTWAIVLDYVLGTIMWTLIGRAFMNNYYSSFMQDVENKFGFGGAVWYPIFDKYWQIV